MLDALTVEELRNGDGSGVEGAGAEFEEVGGVVGGGEMVDGRVQIGP